VSDKPSFAGLSNPKTATKNLVKPVLIVILHRITSTILQSSLTFVYFIAAIIDVIAIRRWKKLKGQ